MDIAVIVVDDDSTDATTPAARHAADALGMGQRLTVIKGQPLPNGWSGKLWAVQQGLEEALRRSPQFVLLTDADIEHSPGSLFSLASIAQRGNLDLASYMVKLHCVTLPERLLVPAFVYFFFQLYPPAWISDSGKRIAGAAGGCILIRTEALTRVGEMHSIRHEIIDDCALAREVKRTGGKVWLGLTENVRSIRPYRTFGEIERMIARTAFNQLRHSPALLMVAIFGLLLTYVVPVLLLAGPYPWLGAFTVALMTLSYWPMVRFYRISPAWALTLPIAAIFYMAATIDSAFRYWLGQGGLWKGRAQDRAGAGNA